MHFPVLVSTTPLRAWVGGVAMAGTTVLLPFATLWLPALVRFGISFYLVPVGIAATAFYALLVRPTAFAASGALLGVLPFVAMGIIDGLQRCASFNRNGPSGGCEADPSAQLLILAFVYMAALVATACAPMVAWTPAARDTRARARRSASAQRDLLVGVRAVVRVIAEPAEPMFERGAISGDI